jgi:hypothetical protein
LQENQVQMESWAPFAEGKKQYFHKRIAAFSHRSFTAGGTVITSAGEFDPKNLSATGGQTLHRNYVYAFYQHSRQYPLPFF